MTGWRYILTRLNGDGTETLLNPELALGDVRVLDTLSAPPSISATVRPEILAMKDIAGRPVFREWSSAIYAEADGVIRAGGIVTHISSANEELNVEATGFLGYPDGQGWIDEPGIFYEVDPANAYRWAWAKLQARGGANLGLTFDATTTSIRVGKKATGEPNTTGATQDEPLVFANYATTDLGKDLGDLLIAGALEVRETHTWSTTPGKLIDHHVTMATPRLGRKLPHRFVIGENVIEVPGVETTAEEYASAVLVVGAGEGPSALMQAYLRPPAGRLYRAVSVSRKDIATVPVLNSVTMAELNRRMAVRDGIEDLLVRDTPHSPLSSISPGDEISVSGDAGWAGELNVSARVLSIEYSPDHSAAATIRVIPSERAYQ